MDQFDTYFRRADLDQDGRISGSEAVAFFQGSNLPQQVLAQIWTYADRNQTGFLGRAEFYNALKLVTVAQSKRDLTPDIVKAALYGPASAKIPAPQINSAASPAPQPNLRPGAPAPQFSGVVSTASQSIGIRGPQGFSSQQTQFMRPPRPPPPSTAFQSQTGVVNQGMPGVVIWHILGLRAQTTGGPAAGVTSQIPGKSMSPSTTQEVFGPVASGFTPSTQSRSQTTTSFMQPAVPKPNDPPLPASQVGTDSKVRAVTENGFASDSVFGDVFAASPTQPEKESLVHASSAGGLSVSSAMMPISAQPRPTGNQNPLDSLPSTPSPQPVVSQHQQIHSTVKQNQEVSVQGSTAIPVRAGNVASGQSQLAWPRMTHSDVQKYSKVFVEVDTDRDGKISGEQARNLFLSWKLPREVLKQVWDLSDQDNDSMLSLREFCIALYLMERYRDGCPLPAVLPSSVMFDQTLLPGSNQPAAAHGHTVWRPSPGLQQQQGVTVARSTPPAAGGRPPRPVPVPQVDEATQPSQQKPRVPVLEKHLVDQLSTEEQNSLNSKFQEATEAEKKVAELEKDILDAKEKINFFHTKMQELILYKSRCDNRLNEITERASGDKREVETLAKKYEEKYKQAGDVASKLTIEEATFRDIQDKKMELYRAIAKMEQDGSVDGTQDRANRIQLNLEDLVKDLNERCKTYSLRAKPTSLVELPFGWQPGIQGGAADWDEDWDKFSDEGFTFVKELTLEVQNVVAPPKPKAPLVQDKASFPGESVTVVSSSNADVKSEKLPGAGERIPEDEGASVQSEEGMVRSPPESPARGNAVESPCKKFQDRRDIGGDASPRATETQSEHGGAESVLSGDKNFDEPGWGSFDTHYDTDSVWDFNPSSTKDTDRERHNESSFFGSHDWDNIFQKKSPLAFADSVPSTPIVNSVSSPHADSFFQKKSPFAFADSVPSSPMFNNSPRRFSAGSEEQSFDSFSRFDSFNMNDHGVFPTRESFTRFDSMRSTADSDYSHGFTQPPESLTRFDSMRSTADSDYGLGLFPPRDSLTRFDSIRSTRDSEYGHGFPSFDDTDPFGSSEPFKISLESQTPRRDSDSWRAF
ncbi:unnamed protein product [Ilex paraguariensis]|uniref:Uncharacterized protein n=1 Tax=Ilex paraguariensis TaxID=185542 RepID=A0ABC8QXS6_9AQUA